MRKVLWSGCCLTILGLLATGPAVADGFVSPLFGLAAAPNGDILVADAGSGVVEFKGGETLEIALPGITDISPIGRSSLWVTRTGTEPLADSGQALLRVSNGSTRVIANLFAFEAAYDPDGGSAPESNPFDVQSLGGQGALVADAAANDLLQVDNRGQIEVLAVFPKELVSTADLKALLGCPSPAEPLCFLPPMLPAQAVPTSVTVGGDGAYYVGELKGFPAPLGESRIWRVAPEASWASCGTTPDCEVVFDGGFTSIIDMAFGPDGLLYVLEFDEASWFAVELGLGVGATINACDLDSLICEEVVSGLPIATAIAFDKRGGLWATQNALIPGLATVVAVP